MQTSAEVAFDLMKKHLENLAVVSLPFILLGYSCRYASVVTVPAGGIFFRSAYFIVGVVCLVFVCLRSLEQIRNSQVSNWIKWVAGALLPITSIHIVFTLTAAAYFSAGSIAK